VYTSSVATLGISGDGLVSDEDTPVSLDDMVGHYKRSKFMAEELVTEMVREKGLPAVIVNPSTPVGPRDIKPTPTGRMVIEAASGRMPVCVDTGLNFVHVDDVAEGHLLAMERGKPGERYILGAENLTLLKFLETVSEISGCRPPLCTIPHGMVYPVAVVSELWARFTGRGEPLATVDGVKLARKKMFFSTDKARRELGYRPGPVRQALEEAVEWFMERGYLA
jgi:dihydroflavonol-4-reductase